MYQVDSYKCQPNGRKVRFFDIHRYLGDNKTAWVITKSKYMLFMSMK